MNAYVNTAFRNGTSNNFRASSQVKKNMANNKSFMKSRSQNTTS